MFNDRAVPKKPRDTVDFIVVELEDVRPPRELERTVQVIERSAQVDVEKLGWPG
jgi:hypothetical protein